MSLRLLLERLDPATTLRDVPIDEALAVITGMINRLDRPAPGLSERISHGRFQQLMAVTAAAFGVLAGGEAYFEHRRGSFNQRWMWTPVWATRTSWMRSLHIRSARSSSVSSRPFRLTSCVMPCE